MEKESSSKVNMELGSWKSLLENEEKLKTNIVKLSKGDCYYEMLGNEGPLVVCMHGISWWSFCYKYVADELVKNGFRVLIFDFYGRGFSASLDETFTPQLLQDQTIELLDALKITEKFYLIGLSMGGYVATRFAANYPERIIKLVLLAPAITPVAMPFAARLITYPYIGKFLFNRFGLNMMLKRLHDERFKNDFQDITMFPTLIDDLVERVEWSLLKKPHFPTMFHSTLCNFPFLTGALELVDDLAKHDVKVMLIWGTKDAVVPYSTHNMVLERHPKAELVTLEGIGHALIFEAYEDVVKNVVPFFKKD